MPKPVYYIYGTEEFLMEEALASIKAETLSGGFASMNYHAFDAKADPSEITAAASTMPAFSPFRLVVVKDAEDLKGAQEEALVPYIKNPSPTTCLVFMAYTAKIDRGSSFIKALSDASYLKPCNRLTEGELLLWIKKEAKKENKVISDGAARKLVDIGGDKLRDIKGEFEKILLFSGDKQTIEEKDVEDAGLDCREETIFNLSDAIGAKDLKKALKVYGKLSDEEPLKVLGAISRQIRMLLKIKILLRKGTPLQKLPSLMGLYPKYADDYVKRSRRFSESELKKAIERLCEADSDLKSSRLPQPLILPKLIMGLCGG